MNHSPVFTELKKTLVWKIIVLLRRISRRLSDRNRLWLGRIVGDCFYMFSRGRVNKATASCARLLEIHPHEARKIIRRSYRNLGRCLTELMVFSHDEQHTFEQNLAIEGLPNLESALARGRGVILLSAHVGNWEMAAGWLGRKGFPIKVIGARQPDPRITNLIERIRTTFGVKTLWTDTGLRETLNCLRNNQILGVLFDQDGGPKGVLSLFLGVPARTVTGPIRLAQKTGALILPTLIIRQRHNPACHTLIFFPAWEVPPGDETVVLDCVQTCNDLISSWIRQYPDQWLYQGWLYDRWIFGNARGNK